MVGEHVQRQEQAVLDIVSECTASEVSLCLWRGDSSGTREGERPLLEAGSRELVKGSGLRGPCACLMNCRVCEIAIAISSVNCNLRNFKRCVQ
jgi:hypothetical protein